MTDDEVAQLRARFTDAVRKSLDELKIRSTRLPEERRQQGEAVGSVRLNHVSLDELCALNDRLCFMFRSLGLKDHALDEAIVAALHPALEQIEASR